MAYEAPTADEFLERFPEFEDVEDEQVEFALAEALRHVGENWLEDDFQLGVLLLTAHLVQTVGGAYDSGGLRSFSLGPISVTYADTMKTAELGTTSYGQRYKTLRDKNVRGPVVV